MKYNFDEIIDRSHTNSMNKEGYKDYLFGDIEELKIPYSDDELVRMWIADMDFAVAPEIIDAITARLNHRILGYSKVFDGNYYKAFLNWTESRYGWSFKKEHLLTSPGIIPALYNLIEYISKPDEKVLFITPSYAFFKHAADYNNIEVITSDLKIEDGDYKMDFEDLEHKLKDDKVTLSIFCNPHNPTGRVWTEEELTNYGQLCLDNDVMIISDEIHCDLLRADKTHIPLAKLFPDTDQIITAMAPSKTFNMAGMMFSNIIIPNDELRATWNLGLSIDNPLSIAGAQAAYEHGAEWLKELTDYVDSNFNYLKSFLDEHLPETNYVIPDSTYLAWVDVSAYLPNIDNLSLFMVEQAGVLIEGGHMFVDNGTGHIRLNLAVPQSVVKEGLNRIYNTIQDHMTIEQTQIN